MPAIATPHRALFLALGLTALFPAVAPAKPWLTKTGNCTSCHGAPQPGLLEVAGHEGFSDPAERPGVPDRGSLKFYGGQAGQLRQFYAQLQGMQAGDIYAIALTGLNAAGVVANSTLSYSPDCAWPEWPGATFTDIDFGHKWGSGPTLARYDLTIGMPSSADCHELVLCIAGRRANSNILFYGEERFYLQVGAPNAPPIVSITSPTSGALFVTPADVPLVATADDPDGTVERVEFLSGAVLLGAAMNAPYSFTWAHAPAGTHVITARAIDNGGAVGVSDPITITVQNPPRARADFDGDGDVDQADFGHLQVCLSGFGVVQGASECQDAKLDGDSDIDQDDAAAFARCMTGEGRPADPNCQ